MLNKRPFALLRRLALSLFFFTLLLTVLPPTSLVVQAQAPQQESQAPIQQLRGFWADTYNPGFRNHTQVDEMIDNIARANANTLFIQMRRHGDAWYNKSLEPRANDSRLAPASQFDPLAYAIERGHSKGISVHAWLVVSVVCPGDDQRGSPQHVCTAHGPNAKGAERWTTADYNGNQIGELDFGHPGAIIYMEQLVQNLLRNYPGLDGIHLDFIRYGWDDHGYNNVSLDFYRRQNGLEANFRPKPDAALWSQWRRDRITELVRRIYLRSKAINPQIQVSAATISWGGLGTYDAGDWPNSAAYKTVFQDWKAWLQEGILDFALPMQYFDEGKAENRKWYNGWLQWDRENTGRRTIVVGMGSWLNSRAQNIAQAERALATDSQGRQLSGVAFYSYNQPFYGAGFEQRRQFMDELRNTIFKQPAQAPVWPWIAYPTKGHLQGIASIDGQMIPFAVISLLKDGQWVRDLTASADGWYGAIDLDPGNYTIAVRDKEKGRTAEYQVSVEAGLVTNGP